MDEITIESIAVGSTSPRKTVSTAVSAQPVGEPRVWRSCCLRVDKSMCIYLTQIGLIVGVMCFCIVQLLLKPDCVSQTMYLSLLTLLIGLVIPSPKH